MKTTDSKRKPIEAPIDLKALDKKLSALGRDMAQIHEKIMYLESKVEEFDTNFRRQREERHL